MMHGKMLWRSKLYMDLIEILRGRLILDLTFSCRVRLLQPDWPSDDYFFWPFGKVRIVCLVLELQCKGSLGIE